MKHSGPSRAPSYEEFNAVSLYCPHCRAATPVRERLLLVLPDGDLYEYRCARCNTHVGKKKDLSRETGGGFASPTLVMGR
ncbi:MAG: hypothetical protein ACE5JI_09870 [Acidobacteriota bacterium]